MTEDTAASNKANDTNPTKHNTKEKRTIMMTKDNRRQGDEMSKGGRSILEILGVSSPNGARGGARTS